LINPTPDVAAVAVCHFVITSII